MYSHSPGRHSYPAGRAQHTYSTRPELPSREQAEALAGWLAGPRSRVLRRASIGRREDLLEAGAGHCVVTPELMRRVRGTVTCIDVLPETVQSAPIGAGALCADFLHMPFPVSSFDAVFFQNSLMWCGDIPRAASEAVRVLTPGGALIALEPDYGGMLEEPHMGLRDLWLAGLSRAGADPCAGRKIPAACEAASLDVWVEFAHVPQQADAQAILLLDDLPLHDDERTQANSISSRIAEKTGAWQFFVHVPYFLVVATKPNL